MTKELSAMEQMVIEINAMKKELAESKVKGASAQVKKVKIEVLPTIKARSELPVEISYSEYKGNDLVSLKQGQMMPFSFGKGKARMIVAQFEAIKAFAESK